MLDISTSELQKLAHCTQFNPTLLCTTWW